MTLTSKEKNETIESLTKRFADFPLITYDYLLGFIAAYEKEEKFYDGFELNTLDCPKDSNPYLYILFKIQSFIYTKLCRLASDDIDVLLQLVNDRQRVANMVCRKLKFTDETKKEDYLIDAITCYDGVEAIDSHITRFLMAKIRGVEFVPKTNEPVRQSNPQPVANNDKAKKKEKKKKKKKGTIVPNPESPKNIETSPNLPQEPQMEEVSAPQAITIPENTPKVEIIVPKETVKVEPMTPYEMCVKAVENLEGSLEKDEFVQTFLSLGTYALIDVTSNTSFAMYVLLRFGFIKERFYNLNEIAIATEKDLKEILLFEKFAIAVMRQHINIKIDNYLSLLLENK